MKNDARIIRLTEFLESVIAQEAEKPIEVLGGYIVGELIGDYDDFYGTLYDENQTVRRIGDIASDLEISNGSEAQLGADWEQLKSLAKQLGDSITPPSS
jgi:hypothetical protein